MSVEPTDQEALVKVNEALAILGQQLAAAEATYAAAEPCLAAAEAALVPLLAEQRRGTGTAEAVGSMPMSVGGYSYQTAPLSDLARRLERAQAEFEDARLAATAAGAGIVGIRVRLDRLRQAQRTLLERLGLAGVENA